MGCFFSNVMINVRIDGEILEQCIERVRKRDLSQAKNTSIDKLLCFIFMSSTGANADFQLEICARKRSCSEKNVNETKSKQQY